MVEGVFHDIRYEIRFVFFRDDGAQVTRQALEGKVGAKIKDLDQFLQSDRPFVLGDRPTLADFHVAAIYYQLDACIQTYALDRPPMDGLARIYHNLMHVESIAAYLKTDKAKRPFAPPSILKNIDTLKELHGPPNLPDI